MGIVGAYLIYDMTPSLRYKIPYSDTFNTKYFQKIIPNKINKENTSAQFNLNKNEHLLIELELTNSPIKLEIDFIDVMIILSSSGNELEIFQKTPKKDKYLVVKNSLLKDKLNHVSISSLPGSYVRIKLNGFRLLEIIDYFNLEKQDIKIDIFPYKINNEKIISFYKSERVSLAGRWIRDYIYLYFFFLIVIIINYVKMPNNIYFPYIKLNFLINKFGTITGLILFIFLLAVQIFFIIFFSIKNLFLEKNE